MAVITEVEKQASIAERLQLKWLETMERLLDSGQATSTDLATLSRFLSANGWTLDPAKLPKELRDKITSHIKPEELDETDREQIAGYIG